MQFNSKRRFSPNGCESCYMARETLYAPCRFNCPPPCPETQCYYCPGNTDSGLLHSIRNGFQKIFNGNRKRGCAPMCKGKVYNYSTSQLRCMEQQIDKLEEDICCIDIAVKEAFDYNTRINCNELKCLLANVSERLEIIRCDLICASDCYDPYRDRYEYQLICSMLERIGHLDSLTNDLCLQLDCLDCKPNYFSTPCEINCRKPRCVKRPACKPNCKKPCCYRPLPCNDCYIPSYPKPFCRPPCELDCRKPCCFKPVNCEPGCQKECCPKAVYNNSNRKNFSEKMGFDRPPKWRSGNGYRLKPEVCRTSSVIPVGVMLVKL